MGVCPDKRIVCYNMLVPLAMKELVAALLQFLSLEAGQWVCVKSPRSASYI